MAGKQFFSRNLVEGGECFCGPPGHLEVSGT